MKTVLLAVLLELIFVAGGRADQSSCCDHVRADGSCVCTQTARCSDPGSESEMCWRPIYLLSGPAAIVKGLGASVWCIGNMSARLFSDVNSFGEGVTATLIWPFAVVADSLASTVSYEVVGVAHTISFGFLMSDPPKPIENIEGPIYCVLSADETETHSSHSSS